MTDRETRPLIWVLKGLRNGDTAQAMELALQVGGRVEGKQLSFNGTHAIPNWLMGARVSHLTQDARKLLRPPWPDLVIATGKRTAPASIWIKNQSGGKTRSVHLGRPRMALSLFDLIVTTPQYGLPKRENVAQITLPFARHKTVVPHEIEAFQKTWADLPRPWVVGVMGGPKFPQHMGRTEFQGFGAMLEKTAREKGGSVILLDSPRTPTGAIDVAAAELTVPHWRFRRGVDVNPYQPALSMGDAFIVTSDSVSMVAEMVLTGKPTSIYRLPTSRLAPKWSAQTGMGALLAVAGILHPPRDVDGLMTLLQASGLISDTAQYKTTHTPAQMIGDHKTIVNRIRSLVGLNALA
jgi:uncharacterized protein